MTKFKISIPNFDEINDLLLILIPT